MPTALSDADIDRFIADPALITTHDQALEILDCLDGEIADIQAKVDACQIEHQVKSMPEATPAWLRRASYACAMRRNARHRVMQRDKELRGTKTHAGAPNPEKKAANLVKQQRLADEAAIRKLAKQNEYLRLQNERESLALKRREFNEASVLPKYARLRMALTALIYALEKDDEEGLIGHAEPIIAAKAALAN